MVHVYYSKSFKKTNVLHKWYFRICSFFENFDHSYISLVWYLRTQWVLNPSKHNDFDFAIFGYYYLGYKFKSILPLFAYQVL